MEKFIDLLLGTNDIPTYLAALVFAVIGALIMQLIKSKTRDKHSPNTPYNFSWKFLVWDNLREVLLGLMFILLALRFSVEFAGVELTMYYALCVGLGLQKVAQWITNLEQKARG